MNEKELQELITKLLDDREKGLIRNPEFIKKMTEALSESLKAALGTGDIAQLKKNLETISAEMQVLRTGVKGCNVDQLNGVYKGCWGSAKLAQDFGLFVLASVMGSEKALKTLEARGYTDMKGMTGDDNPSGGLFIPTQLIDGFIMLIADYGVARRKAMVYPMLSDMASGIKLDTGLKVYCTQQGVVPDAQDFKNRILSLVPMEWNVYVPIDRTLDEDTAIMLGNVVGELMAMALAEQEDDCLFNGDGTSDYFKVVGIVGQLKAATCTKGLITGSSSTWGALTLKDHRAVQAALHPNAWKGEGPSWYCSPQYYFEVMMGLADDAGGNTALEIVMSEAAGKRKFLGSPVEFAPLSATTAVSDVPCVYGNLKRGAMIGDRRKTTVEQSKEALFLQRQIAVLATERIAFNVYGCHDVKTDKLTRAGTIVGLKTKASG